MLTCKQVSKSLENGDYAKLPLLARWGLRLHVATCIFCGKYNRQRILMHDLFRKLRSREDTGEALSEEHISEDARNRIKSRMANQGTSKDQS